MLETLARLHVVVHDGLNLLELHLVVDVNYVAQLGILQVDVVDINLGLITLFLILDALAFDVELLLRD